MVEVLLELCNGGCLLVPLQSLVLVEPLGPCRIPSCRCLPRLHEYDVDVLWALLRICGIPIQSLVHTHYLLGRQGGLKVFCPEVE